jgi:elongator complex protein 3
MQIKQACVEIVEIAIKLKKIDNDKLNSIKNKISKKYKLGYTPTNIEILENLNDSQRKKFERLITTKPVRTLSGVAPIAVMTKPFRCPHGKCIFCPGGPDSFFGNVPMSYTGNEPSTMRAIRADYDSYIIVFNRLEQYILLNQIPDKGEVIIQGGTFPSFPKEYQEEVVKYIFRAMNDFSDMFFVKDKFNFKKFKEFFELPGSINDEQRTKNVQEKIFKLKKPCSFEKEKLRNEKSKIRCIGLTIETKPDWGLLKHGNEMLDLGCTRIELGIQTVYDDVLKKTNRGHTLKQTIESIQILKDLGFKINAHYMLGLYKYGKEDLEGLRELFRNQDFRPDMLKIYPCLVMPGTPLYELWKRKQYKEITTEEAAEILSEFKRDIPTYLRIMRVQRDIPTNVTIAGVDRTNLRQYVDKKIIQKNIKCRCIRCREPHNQIIDSYEIIVEEYSASNGKEFFISAENKEKDVILGFCRLRFPSQFLRKEITKKSALIRELHVYGQSTPIGTEGLIQHKGIGKKLMKKAEEICKRNKKDKLLVISGIGVKPYYFKLGYKRDGPYVSKKIV